MVQSIPVRPVPTLASKSYTHGLTKQDHSRNASNERLCRPTKGSALTSLKSFGGKMTWTISGIVVATMIVAVVITVPIAISRRGSHNNSTTSDSGGYKGGHGDPMITSHGLNTTGGNGTIITLSNGTTFTYINTFGGFWVSDPLNDTAQAQSYTPPLNKPWDYQTDRIYGVNLGSWLVTEPFITPALYEPYENTSNPIGDEYSLAQQYISEGGQLNLIAKMTEHYDTFITEKDFADIAAAGLNWIRLPIGFWAVETYDNEPFLEGVSWQYVLKAITWARKYGLRINLDLHAAPGSQNGNNHSGHVGAINWLNGDMGIVNAQRTLNIVHIITEFISQPEVRNVVPFFSVLNEPQLNVIDPQAAFAYFGQAYTIMRNITGTGADNGPYMTLHDGFINIKSWSNFLRGADRVAYDIHPYIGFSPPYTDNWSSILPKPCNYYGTNADSGLRNNGVTVAGEWSLAVNDCGKYLNNVGAGTRYEGTFPGSDTTYGSCTKWDDYENYSASTKANFRKLALVQMDAYKNFFFWTWKIGPSLVTGKPTSPMWSYSLGLEQGWMPTNIKAELDVPGGACKYIGSSVGADIAATSFSTFSADWMTGAGDSFTAKPQQYNPWPPLTLNGADNDVTALPKLVPTGPVVTLSPLSITPSGATNDQPTPLRGSWLDPNITSGWYVEVTGCEYPRGNPYSVAGYDKGWPCSYASALRRSPAPTSAPTAQPDILHIVPTPIPRARRLGRP